MVSQRSSTPVTSLTSLHVSLKEMAFGQRYLSPLEKEFYTVPEYYCFHVEFDGGLDFLRCG